VRLTVERLVVELQRTEFVLRAEIQGVRTKKLFGPCTVTSMFEPGVARTCVMRSVKPGRIPALPVVPTL